MSGMGQKIIEATRKVAEEKPDFVFADSCAYVVNGQPGCLVGHALWNLGLINADLPGAVNTEGISEVAYHLGIVLDREEYKWLGAAQCYQDTGLPWAEAVAVADEEAGCLD